METRVGKSRRGVLGIVRVEHPWVDPLVLGKTVPPHTIPGGTRKVLIVGKGGKEPKEWQTEGRKGEAGPVFISGKIDHPGYKGFDCATPTEKQGGRVLAQKISRVVVRLAQKIAKGQR